MTRVQKERFENANEPDKLQNRYVLDLDTLQHARENMTVLHPLPRLDEIDEAVDADPRANYFEQARGGRYIRMALISFLLKKRGDTLKDTAAFEGYGLKCVNERCVTNHEKGVKPMFNKTPEGEYKCRYCSKTV